MFNIEAGQMVRSRDVAFDESCICLSTTGSSGESDEFNFDFDCIETDDVVAAVPVDYNQAGKCTNRSRSSDFTSNTGRNYPW